VFTPDSFSVDLNADKSDVNFTTCADTHKNTTMQRSTTAAATDRKLDFNGRSPSGNTKIDFVYKPCGGGGTIEGQWRYSPECRIEGGADWDTRSPYGGHFFKGGASPKFGPEKITNGRLVLMFRGHPAVTISLPKGSTTATITVTGEGMRKTGVPNDITANADTTMECQPVPETFKIQGTSSA
jgi:hypothetical protein